MGKSLIIKINVLVVVVVTIFFLVLGSLEYFQRVRSKIEELHTDLSAVTNRLVKTLKISIWDLDNEKISDAIVAEMHNKNIHSIVVYDVNYKDILSGKTRNDKWGIVEFKKTFEDDCIFKTSRVIHEENIIGYIKVHVTDKFMMQDIRAEAAIRIFRMSVMILVFVLVLSSTIYFAVLKPISALTKTIQTIADGNIEEPIKLNRNDELGKLAKDFGAMRDTVKQKINSLNNEIVERKKITGELRKARNYISNIVDSMPSMLIGVDVEGKVTQWNRAAAQNTGISVSDAEGKKLSDVFPDLILEMKKITESIQTHEVRHERKRERRTEAGIQFEDMTIYPLIANGIQGAVIRIDDVTDKVHMEEMMIQSEKMLSVGGLAAGMAHEINNPIAGMMQTANVLTNRLGEKVDMPANIKAAAEVGTTIDVIKKYMDIRGVPVMLGTINETGKRIAAIVRNMLSFVRKSNAVFSSLSMADMLDNTLELAATEYDLKKQYDFKQIEIKKEYEENLPSVPCEAEKIQQVLLNLLRNGAQAMQMGGIEKPQLVLRTRLEKIKKMVSIEIEDNGPGMTEEIRKRIFEPFFTTKPVGIGTGLGLSVSYFIITENHGGEMSVESIPGEGTKFIIRLPLGEDQGTTSSTTAHQ